MAKSNTNQVDIGLIFRNFEIFAGDMSRLDFQNLRSFTVKAMLGHEIHHRMSAYINMTDRAVLICSHDIRGFEYLSAVVIFRAFLECIPVADNGGL